MALSDVRSNIINSSSLLSESPSNNSLFFSKRSPNPSSELFKSRLLPDAKIMELNKMFEDPLYMEKYPEIAEQLLHSNEES